MDDIWDRWLQISPGWMPLSLSLSLSLSLWIQMKAQKYQVDNAILTLLL